MVKRFLYIIFVLILLVMYKFFSANYSIIYDVKDFKIKEEANKDTMYFEISYNGEIFNYMFYNGRKLTKKRVKDVKVEKLNNGVCLTPVIKGLDTYTVCSDGNTLVSENIIKDEIEDFINNEDFYYNKNLSEDEYVLIWKYDGFYYMNGNEQKSINIFDKDRYSNDLMYQIDKYLIFPKYGEDYLFSDFIVLDMVKGDYKVISTDYKINYNSKVVGEHNSSIFVFDYTSNKLYEINYKKRKCKLVGDTIKGFIKYVDGKKKHATLDDYVKDKYTFFEDNDYISVDKNKLSYNKNNDIKFKYYSEDDVRNACAFKHNLYFVSKDNLLRYNKNKLDVIVHYFEFNFNNGNIVFVYNK